VCWIANEKQCLEVYDPVLDLTLEIPFATGWDRVNFDRLVPVTDDRVLLTGSKTPYYTDTVELLSLTENKSLWRMGSRGERTQGGEGQGSPAHRHTYVQAGAECFIRRDNCRKLGICNLKNADLLRTIETKDELLAFKIYADLLFVVSDNPREQRRVIRVYDLTVGGEPEPLLIRELDKGCYTRECQTSCGPNERDIIVTNGARAVYMSLYRKDGLHWETRLHVLNMETGHFSACSLHEGFGDTIDEKIKCMGVNGFIVYGYSAVKEQIILWDILTGEELGTVPWPYIKRLESIELMHNRLIVTHSSSVEIVSYAGKMPKEASCLETTQVAPARPPFLLNASRTQAVTSLPAPFGALRTVPRAYFLVAAIAMALVAGRVYRLFRPEVSVPLR
jgi:hypothetical protein